MKLYSHFSANNIQLKPFDFKMELAMESYLVENENVLRLGENIYSDVSIIDIELPIKNARKTKQSDGRIDLLALYDNETLGIIELKRGEINMSSLQQLEDYFSETEQVYSIQKGKENEKIITKYEDTKWLGILVGTDMSDELRKTIEEGHMIHGKFPLAGIILKRYKSENGNQIYITADTYFNTQKGTKDTTKYKFLGEIYAKSRLVYAVIKKYIENNPNISYSELDNIFPYLLQGNKRFGTFTTAKNAQDIYEKIGYKRHFLYPDEIISLVDSDIAICNQWGGNENGGNIKDFITHAKTLGFNIEKV